MLREMFTKPADGVRRERTKEVRQMRLFSTCCFLVTFAAGTVLASDLDEFKIQRETVFEFAEKPVVTRQGDRTTITFETKSFCDVTVAIEEAGAGGEASGTESRIQNPKFKIIRHLAAGVLGPNAPVPFQKNSRRQTLVWDGKNDKGEYVDNQEKYTVRVSLGLRARFERPLLWEPKKRVGQEPPPIGAAPEGVYVYDGRVYDYVTLYDHDGHYLRTIYPFPAGQLRNVKGLHWRTLPQDGLSLPMMEGFHQSTLLTSGSNAGFDETLGIGVDVHNNWHGAVWGSAASTMAVQGNRLALARLRLNRLALAPEQETFDLTGPEVHFPIVSKGHVDQGRTVAVPPRSAAFSPDGRYLYLTAYAYAHRTPASRDIVLVNFYDWLPGVARVNFADGAKTEVFCGRMKITESGTDNAHFRMPTSVAVDAQGRVYVSDFANDRVQVFSPDGAYLKTIPCKYPAQVSVNRRTHEIYVFSWFVPNEFTPLVPRKGDSQHADPPVVPPSVTVFKSLDEPIRLFTCPIPAGPAASRGQGVPYRVEVDPWADPPTLWIAAEWGYQDIMSRERLAHPNIVLCTLEGGVAKVKREFNRDVLASVARTTVAEYSRQRLYVNPRDGALFVGEGEAAGGTSFKDLLRIDPETGKVAIVHLPFDAEDMCIDPDGLAYLRTFYLVARYDTETWKEVPFDYGEGRSRVATGSSSDRREAHVGSALRLPVAIAGLHHHGGMNVAPNGNLVIAVNNHTEVRTRKDVYDEAPQGVGDYTPTLYPGRVRWGEIHVFDRFGRPLFEDAIPGMNRTDGLGIDRDNNLYVLATATRVLDGKRYFNDMTETLVKFAPRQGKVLSPSDRAAVPLPAGTEPKRPPDFVNGHIGAAWAEGALWFYGGLGFAGKNAARAGGGCDCYNARFALDSFARSFAPELDHRSVAVLDTNGNLILRIGRYGNADDRAAADDGDGVFLFHAPYLATDTDRRLFIADPGNARVLSVALGYYARETVPLKAVGGAK
jgi:hypothetical protein